MSYIQRPIGSILIANRGEIAIRILQACHELPNPPVTYALYTDSDDTHIALGRPHHALKVPYPTTYMDIGYLIRLVKENKIDAVHPGYGFLSESAEFSYRMWTEANVMVVGPGWKILEQTGDKLRAKALAIECEVSVLKAMQKPTSNLSQARQFTQQVGYPVMIKAVDGGGGRGIRLVSRDDQFENAFERCVSESPSRMVFIEQAAVDGYKHIEVQILGDGQGSVKHLWERDCSVQRRFQKIVEVAPVPPVGPRRFIAQVIDSAIRMARKLKYLGLGTWEFLVNWKQRKFYFLEINPRLQVEHTITECIIGVDLVKEQLLYAQGLQNKDDLRLGEWWEAVKPPSAASIQLRLCAEDPQNNFALSIGKVTDVHFPFGNGIRVDSHLSKGGVVGSDFDNLMAKIMITASTFSDCVTKAKRALSETKIVGVKTNLDLLRAIISSETFHSGQATTEWLESNANELVRIAEQIGQETEAVSASLPRLPLTSGSVSNVSGTSAVLRKGNSWSLVLQDKDDQSTNKPPAHHLHLEKIIRNEFPDALVAEVGFTVPGSKTHSYLMTMNSTSASAEATSSSHRRGDPSNKSHIILPMSGKLIEILVQEGDEVEVNDVIAFVKQMKMELEVRSPRAGTISWAIELENDEGDDVAEGVLLAELSNAANPPEMKSKL